MVECLSSIEEKNLNNCGKLVLTSDMSELSITKVDLSNMNTLEGKLAYCPRASPKELSWEPSPFLLTLLASVTVL